MTVSIQGKEDIMSVVYHGHSVVNKRGASICNLEDCMLGNYIPKGKYQVWSDKDKVYELFQDLGEATDLFIKISKRGG
jgi:hypothetical protein